MKTFTLNYIFSFDTWKDFSAFSGEHIAGTEFVIGSLLVMHGVAARDFFLGLLKQEPRAKTRMDEGIVGAILSECNFFDVFRVLWHIYNYHE